MTAWVLILFCFSGGYPSVAMHDFADKPACDAALNAAVDLEKKMKGIPQVRGTCVPQSSKEASGGNASP